MASPSFRFVRIEGHRLVELDKGFLGREKSPYRAGFRWCRECVAFVQTKERFCDECGQTLATTPRTNRGKRHLHRLLGIKRY